jgi:hypothetical protein
VNGIIEHLSFWFTSLAIILSRLIYVVACVRISFFLRLNNIPLYVYGTFCLSIHLSMDTLPYCNDALVNMGITNVSWRSFLRFFGICAQK